MKRLLFAVAAAALAVAVVEAACRLALAAALRAASPVAAVRARAADVARAPSLAGLGRPPLPDFMRASVVHPYLGSIPDQRTPQDDLGFGLSHDPIQKRSPDKLIVAVLGGSLAHMTANDARQELIDGLARRHKGRHVVLLKLAVPGYKQPQQLMTLAYLLSLGAEFDLVVNLDGYNEAALPAAENAPHGVFPAFPRLWHLRAAQLPPPETLAALGRQALLIERRRRAAERLARAPWRWSGAAAIVWRAADRRLEARLARELAATATAGQRASSYAETGPARRSRTDAELYEEITGLWERTSLAMHWLCRAHGARYVHFLQPNQYLPGSKPLSDEEKKKAYLPDNDFARAVAGAYPLFRRAGARLARGGVAFHDLTELFRGVDETLYVDTCCHVNEKGSRRIAAAVLKAL